MRFRRLNRCRGLSLVGDRHQAEHSRPGRRLLDLGRANGIRGRRRRSRDGGWVNDESGIRGGRVHWPTCRGRPPSVRKPAVSKATPAVSSAGSTAAVRAGSAADASPRPGRPRATGRMPLAATMAANHEPRGTEALPLHQGEARGRITAGQRRRARWPPPLGSTTARRRSPAAPGPDGGFGDRPSSAMAGLYRTIQRGSARRACNSVRIIVG